MAQINHIVVVMLENRSFDNVLGYLYPSRPTFDGVGNTKNPNTYNGGSYMPQPGTVLTDPNPDPNEIYERVYMQLFNPQPFDQPACIPDPIADAPPMTGFVADYANSLQQQGVTDVDPSIIMNCFQPASVPVISALAQNYTVCDHWFASAPTQTFANRSFVHAGTSSGYVDNEWKNPFGILVNDTTTIYNLLEAAGKSWAVYYSGPLFLCNAFLTQKQLDPYALNESQRRFWPYKNFASDVMSAATFPAYSFIEPNFIGNPWYGPENDEHPQANLFEEGGPSNVEYGEALLGQIYAALRQSPEWPSTLLVVLFDEHGGTFDHVPPPADAVAPDSTVVPCGQPGGSSFSFTRYGVRVPAVLVSAWAPTQTVSNTIYDHTSLLRTVIETFGLSGSLGNREPQANSLTPALSEPAARTDSPAIPQPNPPWNANAFTIADPKLTDFQRTLLALAIQRAGDAVERHGLSGLFSDILDDAENLFTDVEAKLDSHSDAFPIIQRLMALEQHLLG
jgi:phospholipase C